LGTADEPPKWYKLFHVSLHLKIIAQERFTKAKRILAFGSSFKFWLEFGKKSFSLVRLDKFHRNGLKLRKKCFTSKQIKFCFHQNTVINIHGMCSSCKHTGYVLRHIFILGNLSFFMLVLVPHHNIQLGKILSFKKTCKLNITQ
jgi:hypothetical protein